MPVQFGGFQAGDFQSDFQTSSIVTDIGPSIITFLPTYTRNQISELSDYYVNIAYFDVLGNSIYPIAAQWRIYDDTNKSLLQDWVSYLPSNASDVLHVAQSYNSINNTKNLSEVRLVTFKITAVGGAIRYDNSYYVVLSSNDVP